MVILNPVPGSEIVSFSVLFSGGASLEPPEMAGVTYLGLRTALKASERISKLQVARITERFGSPPIPDTSHDFSSIVFQLLSRGCREFFEVLKEVLLNPRFDEVDFNVERDILIASARSRRESSFSIGMERFIEMTFEGTPYGVIPYGKAETLSRLSVDDAKRFYRSAVSSRCVISVCGDVTPEVERVSREMEEILSGEGEEPAFEDVPFRFREVEVRREGSEQVLIILGLRTPPVADEDYVALRVLNGVLGEGFGSILFRELRERRGLAYSTGSLLLSRKLSGRLLMYVMTSREKRGAAEDGIEKLKENLPGLIDGEMVERAKRYIEGSYVLGRETRLRRSWYPAWWEVMGKGHKFDSCFLDEVRSVGLERVKSLAERLSESPFQKVVVSGG